MHGRRRVNNWLSFVQSIFLPSRCLLCGGASEGGAGICTACRADLPRLGAVCRHCGRPLASGGTCGACVQRPPPYLDCLAPWLYAPPLDRLIQDLKFGGRLAVARLFGELLAEEVLRRELPLPNCLLPVPLHLGRLRERGFNQAVELAKPLARRLGVPLMLRGCRRIRPTDTQSRLNAGERRRNVSGAFRAAWSRPPQRVVVVDDVLSTGSTVAAVTRALHQAGVEEVRVWAVARAVR